ncbi:hypothetical protein EVAR_29062_1 [Eumeta japonica]|uniref:Uncharacterized protein n=1 Tax=Eumeta variegata TaxID=151549 RepID=A0A4C1VN54_EUMVA|nr:hypothetical protein EVAR_29062_1 [Eumeta japonica]
MANRSIVVTSRSSRFSNSSSEMCAGRGDSQKFAGSRAPGRYVCPSIIFRALPHTTGLLSSPLLYLLHQEEAALRVLARNEGSLCGKFGALSLQRHVVERSTFAARRYVQAH